MKIFIISIFLVTTAFAGELDNIPEPVRESTRPRILLSECLAALKGPIVPPRKIFRNRNIIPYPEEHPYAGTIVRHSWNLGDLKLEDGIYVYLLGNVGDNPEEDFLITNPRFDISQEDLDRLISNPAYLKLIDQMISIDPQVRKFEQEEDFAQLNIHYLVTHRSLYRKIIRDLRTQGDRRKISIMAAGEFVVRNGKIVEISNEANTFRGGTNHLIWSAFRLWYRGLVPELGTVLVDASRDPRARVGPPHARQRMEAYYRILTFADPKLAMYAKELAELYAELAKHIPNPNQPGLLDEERFAQFIDSEIKFERSKIEFNFRSRLENLEAELSRETAQDPERDVSDILERIEDLEKEKRQALRSINSRPIQIYQFLERIHRDGPHVTAVLYERAGAEKGLEEDISLVRNYLESFRQKFPNN